MSLRLPTSMQFAALGRAFRDLFPEWFRLSNALWQRIVQSTSEVSRWGRFQDVDESAYYEFICKQNDIAVAYCAEQFENDGSCAFRAFSADDGGVGQHVMAISALPDDLLILSA
jgi:hypothetical protein